MKCIFDKSHNYLHYDHIAIIPPKCLHCTNKCSKYPIIDNSDSNSSSEDNSYIPYKTLKLSIFDGNSITINNPYGGIYLFKTEVKCINNPNLNFYVKRIIGTKSKITFILNDEVFYNDVWIYITPVLNNYWSKIEKNLTSSSTEVILPNIDLSKSSVIWINSDEDINPEDYSSDNYNSYIKFYNKLNPQNLVIWYYDEESIHNIISIPISIFSNKITIDIDRSKNGFIIAGLYKGSKLSKDIYILSSYYSGNKVIFLFNEKVDGYNYILKYHYSSTEPSKEEIYIE